MNILHVSRSFAPVVGGTERMVAALARHSVERGHRVSILTSDRPPVPGGGSSLRLPAGGSVEEGLEIVRFGFLPVAFLEAPPGWRRELSEKVFAAGVAELERIVGGMFGGAGPDVVHAHGMNDDTFYLCELSRRMSLPLVVTAHGPTDCGLDPAFASRHRYRERVTLAALETAERVTAVSRVLAKRLEHLSSAVASKLSIVPNGVAVLGVPAETSRRSEAFLFAGRLSEEKGPDLLIEAFCRLSRRRPGLLLRVAGAGPLAGELQRLARSSGAGDRIVFLGELGRAEMKDEILAAKALVVPSRFDACPLVALEAIGSGTPLIASDLASLAEIAEPGFECLSFAAGDAVSLERTLDLAATEGRLLRDLAARAVEKARKKFDLCAVSDSYFEIYRLSKAPRES